MRAPLVSPGVGATHGEATHGRQGRRGPKPVSCVETHVTVTASVLGRYIRRASFTRKVVLLAGPIVLRVGLRHERGFRVVLSSYCLPHSSSDSTIHRVDKATLGLMTWNVSFCFVLLGSWAVPS